jgi:hypothetical protein
VQWWGGFESKTRLGNPRTDVNSFGNLNESWNRERCGQTRNPGDRSFARSLRHLDCEYDPLPQMALFASGVCDRTVAYLHQGLGAPSQPACPAIFSQIPPVSTMDTKSQRRRDGALSLLNVAIEAMNLAKEASSATPANAVFGSVSVILTTIRVCFLLVRFNHPQANEYRIA